METRSWQATFFVRKIDLFVTIRVPDQHAVLGGGESATYLSRVSEAHWSPENR
jgi:hypothetical protein